MSFMKSQKGFVKKLADYHYNCFNQMGHAKAGNNGPYKDLDTDMRNTAHWLFTYAYLWKEYHEEKYRELSLKFIEYLKDEDHYAEGYIPICRTKGGEDKTNGLIGLAWIIESLVYAGNIFSQNECILMAERIFLTQVYDKHSHVWKVKDTDCSVKGYDMVTNHQVWFAAAGTMILGMCHNRDIQEQVNDFINNLHVTCNIHPNGLMFHSANCRKNLTGKAKYAVRKYVGELSHLVKVKIPQFNKYYLEEGYHLFDMYGLAILKKYMPGAKVFHTKKFEKSIKYAKSEKFHKLLMEPVDWEQEMDSRAYKASFNGYAFGYNSPAFEYGFVMSVFDGDEDEKVQQQMFDAQIQFTFNEKENTFSYNNFDPYTLTARIYELVRYFEIRNIHNGEEI